MSVYFDASVVVSLFVQDSHTARVSHWLSLSRPAVFVSAWSAAEFSSALALRSRLGAMTPVERGRSEDEFDVWLTAGVQTVEVAASDLARARQMIRRDEVVLRAPDALHLAITERLGVELATLDVRLSDAARSLGVAVAAI